MSTRSRASAPANGVEVTELSTHLQGQLVATHPAYDTLFDGFAPPQFHNNVAARTEWAVDQMNLAAKASRRFGCTTHATFSGALMWHMVYPWPQRPAGLVEEGFAELAAAGSRSSMRSTRTGSMPATNCTQARTCTTG